MEVVGGGAGNIELETATISGTISNKEVQSLGLERAQLHAIDHDYCRASAIRSGQDEAKVGIAGSAKFSVNGGRVEYNTYEVDGSDVLNTSINASRGQGEPLIVYPSIDAIQDIQVLTSNYGAMYGKTASGSVMVTTKSGDARISTATHMGSSATKSSTPATTSTSLPGGRRSIAARITAEPSAGRCTFPTGTTRKRTRPSSSSQRNCVWKKTPVAYQPGGSHRGRAEGDFSDVCPASAPNGRSYLPITTRCSAAYPDCPVLAPDSTRVNQSRAFPMRAPT